MEKNKKGSFWSGLKNTLAKIFIGLFNLFKKIVLDVKDNPAKTATRIVVFTAIIHLILSNIQIKTLTVLENEISGFVMFMFILIGLACLFNAIRFKDLTIRKIILTIVMLLAVIGVGSYLVYIYVYAIGHQNLLKSSEVMPGIILSSVMLGLYLFGLVETIIAVVVAAKNGKINEKVE